jgi:hypothetical protein
MATLLVPLLAGADHLVLPNYKLNSSSTSDRPLTKEPPE